MSTFIGNIEARSDQKGRIFIPATYRRLLTEAGGLRLIMRRDADNDCLVFYPEPVWNQKLEQLKQVLDEWNADDQLLLMQFVSEAERLDLDSQGRVLIQKRYLQSINAGNDLLFVGMMDRFALWDKATYESRRLSAADFASRLRERMARTQL